MGRAYTVHDECFTGVGLEIVVDWPLAKGQWRTSRQRDGKERFLVIAGIRRLEGTAGSTCLRSGALNAGSTRSEVTRRGYWRSRHPIFHKLKQSYDPFARSGLDSGAAPVCSPAWLE